MTIDLDKYRTEAFAAKERADRASNPPWPAEIWHGNDGGFAAIGPVHKFEDENEFESPDDENGEAAERDADFIARARTDVPILAGHVETLVAEVERLEASNAQMSKSLVISSTRLRGLAEALGLEIRAGLIHQPYGLRGWVTPELMFLTWDGVGFILGEMANRNILISIFNGSSYQSGTVVLMEKNPYHPYFINELGGLCHAIAEAAADALEVES